MLFWKIALQVLAVAIAIIVNRLDYVTRDKRTSKFKSGRRWLFILSICFLIASIIVIIKDETAKSKEIAALTNQLNTIKRQVENTQKSITGGNNLCYVNLANANADKNVGILVIVNDGDYPLYDISFRMWDPADYGPKAQVSKSLEEFIKKSINMNVGNLPPHSVKTLGNVKLPNSDSKNFEVTILARNGSFTERLRLRKKRGEWKWAFRVHAGNNRDESTVLVEKADVEFPRDNNGKIQWE
ncbi:MAG: hypothetical protein ILNGONEN_00816 [Syntrophorhabdaceae bacterium]|nr:hypothetical protein [Syntrophorhabdaceae bacterium]